MTNDPQPDVTSDATSSTGELSELTGSAESALDAPPADVDGAGAAPASVESRTVFRLGRLLLFLQVAAERGRSIPSIDRLGYYEFFADNPFIILDRDEPKDSADRIALELAGFSPEQLSYASSGQRFVSRRQRLQHDLALLIARNLVVITDDGFTTSTRGSATASAMRSVYADAYRVSAEVVLRRLWAWSGVKLENAARNWLGDSWLLIDLLDDIDTTTPEPPAADPDATPVSESPPVPAREVASGSGTDNRAGQAAGDDANKRTAHDVDQTGGGA